jgi:hypothetical protein
LFGIKLNQSLIAVAIPLSLPPSYNATHPILTKSTDKHTSSPTKDATLEHKQTHHGASPTITLHTQVGARKGKKMSNRSTNSRNSKLQRKCTHCCKPIHKEYKHCQKKANEMAATEKKQNDAELTADTTAKAACAKTISYSAASSHNEERI